MMRTIRECALILAVSPEAAPGYYYGISFNDDQPNNPLRFGFAHKKLVRQNGNLVDQYVLCTLHGQAINDFKTGTDLTPDHVGASIWNVPGSLRLANGQPPGSDHVFDWQCGIEWTGVRHVVNAAGGDGNTHVANVWLIVPRMLDAHVTPSVEDYPSLDSFSKTDPESPDITDPNQFVAELTLKIAEGPDQQYRIVVTIPSDSSAPPVLHKIKKL